MESKTANIAGVVDRRLSVRGIKNLKVVDASVFPHLTSGNPHAAILMIAERSADSFCKTSSWTSEMPGD
ncbi:hypothetical protein TNCT_301651 [Trichonephila clavata]|uniref:Glucose-methanol-choline oxidoreductase C-terminal domain-containing protein n=1 Tax=Trichonephila clavata TaxID=2740835 RepID=A0A8X6I6G3_TRICU|nr:hypothetical protein TNCT_301651 [Trichonephila clavata]